MSDRRGLVFGISDRPSGPVNFKCVECAAAARDGAADWKAYLTDDENEPATVAIYCPECAKREFGS